jgi:hypothetical protein
MPPETYKNPSDFKIPDTYRPIGSEELSVASESPELKPLVRFFAQQVKDVQSAFIKGEESEEDRAFLRQCRKDSKDFRHALQREISSAATRLKNDRRVAFILDGLTCSNRLPDTAHYHFSVEIRPLLFTSLLSEDEKEEERYPFIENKFTVFLHLDELQKFQMTRFAEPETVSSAYTFIMSALLSVFSTEKIKPLLEQHYGNWDILSSLLVEEMVESLRNMP